MIMILHLICILELSIVYKYADSNISTKGVGKLSPPSRNGTALKVPPGVMDSYY